MRALRLATEVFDDVEKLLYHTRGSVPEAIVLEHALVDKVAQLDLIALLRLKRPLHRLLEMLELH